MPELENGETVYKMTPEEFADACEQLVDAGASVVGGCCGTRPDHIKALADCMRGKKVEPIQKKNRPVLTSERGFVEVTLDGGFKVVGERINPTGKKALQEELRSGSMQMVRQFARDQEIAGAAILDVNMGTNGIDEKATMLDAIYEVISTVDLPLSIDTSYVDVMEAALRIYPGRALINSISCRAEKNERTFADRQKVRSHVCSASTFTQDCQRILDEKKEHITHVLEAARAIGLQDNDAVVDVLVATVGANPSAALECFETISYCKDTLHLPTICGLSNISFGMPQRILCQYGIFECGSFQGTDHGRLPTHHRNSSCIRRWLQIFCLVRKGHQSATWEQYLRQP